MPVAISRQAIARMSDAELESLRETLEEKAESDAGIPDWEHAQLELAEDEIERRSYDASDPWAPQNHR